MKDLFQCTCPHCGQLMQDIPQGGRFQEFWNDCPVKLGKQQSQKAWKKLTTAQKEAARKNVKAWYWWFAKQYPKASSLHPSTYLNQRRWEDEGWTPPPKPTDPFKSAADAILSAQKWRCTNIAPSTARTLIEQGHVTTEQCRAVGVL